MEKNDLTGAKDGEGNTPRAAVHFAHQDSPMQYADGSPVVVLALTFRGKNGIFVHPTPLERAGESMETGRAFCTKSKLA
jgi:hypothetical protein